MADIKVLAPFILSWEGGFVNDPDDRGGATNKGVTLSTWKSCGYDKNGDGVINVEDVKLITEDDAVNRVMKPYFWDKWQGDRINSQSVANICVDWVWGSGSHGITKVQTLLGVKADGIVGEKTLAALNAEDPQTLFKKIWARREQFINSIAKGNQAKFLKGWLNRLNAIQFGSLKCNGNKLITFNDR